MAQPVPLAPASPADRNEVVLVGRLAGPPEERVLPSGDPITSFRVVVRRPDARGRGEPRQRPSRRASVDAVDCTAWRADARRLLRGWQAGDVVEVTGALWRSPARCAGGSGGRRGDR